MSKGGKNNNNNVPNFDLMEYQKRQFEKNPTDENLTIYVRSLFHAFLAKNKTFLGIRDALDEIAITILSLETPQ